MNASIGASTAAVVAVLLWSAMAVGQAKPDCTPHKVEGKIVKIDMDQGKLTLQGPDGKTIEFSASKEALQDKKVGDKLEVAKRLPEGCK
jgi:hypothetical protein